MLAGPIVEFEKVAFCYGGVEVLHSLSLALHKGEIVGLLGPNGAGKTTTIKIIAGILAPAAGRVSVCGLPLPERAVSVKERIGYVPEAAVLFESLTGQEFLELTGRLHDVGEDTLQTRMRSILETFGLYSDRVSRLDTYSKGMRQKILIAAALLHDPEVVILDEPFSGLDINSCLVMRRLMQSLAAAGRTVLFSSHDLETVEKVCSSVVILHRGKVVASGSVAELRALMHLPNLEEIFAQLVCKQDGGAVVSGFVQAMRL